MNARCLPTPTRPAAAAAIALAVSAMPSCGGNVADDDRSANERADAAATDAFSAGEDGEGYVPDAATDLPVELHSSVITLASGQPAPNQLVLDASYVYWSSLADAAVRRVRKTGGLVEEVDRPLGDAGAGHGGGIAISTDWLFWTEPDGGHVFKTKRSPGWGTLVYSGQYGVGAIAANDAYAFWYDSAFLVRTPAVSGSPMKLVPVSPNIKRLATSGSAVAWTDTDGNVLRAAIEPDGGASLEVVASSQSAPGAIALDGSHVYWSTEGSPDGCGVWRVASTTATPAPIEPVWLPQSCDDVCARPRHVAPVGAALFVAFAGEGCPLLRVAEHSAPETIAVEPGTVGAIAADESGVFWTVTNLDTVRFSPTH